MMSSNNNFLLKIHMEEENNIKEIYLNKERRSFTFINDECVSDLVIPEFKVTSLNMILRNIDESNGEDTFYAEYEINDELVREYDKEKIFLLENMATKININEFFDYQDTIKINDYYVDNIIDAYNCVLPIEMKRLLSYTTNGVVFSGKDKIYMLPHDDIVDFKKNIKNFIPLMIKNDNIYIGYDYKESLYKEYKDDKKIKEAKTLKGLVILEEIEILDLNKDYSTSKKEPVLEEKIEKVDEEYENVLKNIDYQFERLNNGLVKKEEKEVKQQEEKTEERKFQDDSKEKLQIKQEIREGILKSLEEIEKTNNIIDEIDTNLENVVIKNKNIIENKDKKNKNKKDKDIIKTPKIKSDNIDIDEEEKEKENKQFIEQLKENDKKQLQEKLQKEAEEKRLKEQQEKEQREKERKEKEKQAQEELASLKELLYSSITNGLNNYKINFNDTQKLTVEHLPYYEFTNDFDVIQIPEIEVDKITLLPNSELDFGKIKFVVNSLNNDKVDLLVQSASLIVDKDNNKIKNGTHLILDLKNEITLRLNKKGVMETWTLRMEKSTFEKELRNIDYGKIMRYITNLEGYQTLGNIEKYELQKSVMLFTNFIMENKDEKTLEELYKILEDKPTLYEEYITRYNIDNSLKLKDYLATYDHKKNYVNKLNYVNGLIDAKWLDYPRYIFRSHDYFYNDKFLEEFIDDLNNSLQEKDFSDYLKKMFKQYEMFENLEEEGKDNLDKCLEYLSVLYKTNPDIGEENKYKLEKSLMVGATEEDIALLISKLCRKGIKDYAVFIEYDTMMKEKYRLGELKYPIFSESFGLEEIRNGGEYDEY